MSQVYDIAIIGGGPVGMWAGFYAGFRGLQVLMIESTPELGGQVSFLYPDKEISDLPGIPSVKGRTLVDNLREQLMRFNPDIRTNEGVLDIDEEGDIFKIYTNKDSYKAKFIILSTGIGVFTPNKLPINLDSYEGHGVIYFVKDKAHFKGRKLLIVGGGNTAVDWALELKDIAKELTLIHRRDVFRALEKNVQRLMSSNIQVKLFYNLIGVNQENGELVASIQSTQSNDIEKLHVDDILILIGYKADMSIAKKWGLTMNSNGIKVDDYFQTSRKGIYAVGDTASPDHMIKENLLVIEFAQATIAVNAIKKSLEPTAPSFVHSTTVTQQEL